MASKQRFSIRVGEREHEVIIEGEGEARRFFVDGIEHEVLPVGHGRRRVAVVGEATQTTVALEERSRPQHASVKGRAFDLQIRSAREAAIEAALTASGGGQGQGSLKAPMPGRVVRVMASVGQSVEQGQAIVIVEAMKMENELHAPCTGEVLSVEVSEGDTVDANQLLLEVSPARDPA